MFILPYTRPFIPEHHIINHIENTGLGTRFEAQVLRPPLEYNEKTYLLVDVKRIYGTQGPATGRIRLFVKGRLPNIKTGDRVMVISRLREARNFGNPGEFDLRWHYRTEDIYVLGAVEDPRFIVKVKDGRVDFFQSMDSIRQKMSRFIERNSSNPLSSAVLKALLLGEQSAIPPDIRKAFSATGTSHILSISGLHMGIVAYSAYRLFFFVFGLSERLTLALNIRKLAGALSLVPLFFYAMLAGFLIPAQRSMLMVSAFVAVFLFDRGKDFFNTLALAAFIMLAFSPASLWAPSFLLSFAAVFSIVFLVPGLKEMFDTGQSADVKKKELKPIIGGLIGFFRKNLFISVAATLGTAPIAAYYFNVVSLYGFLANLLVVPLMGFLAVVLGMTSAVFLLFSEGLAALILNLADLSVVAGIWCVRFFARLPLSSIRIATPTWIEVSLFYILVIAVFKLRKRRILAPVVAIALAGLIAGPVIRHYNMKNDNDLKVTFLSVGQGDSMLVEFPQGKTMLIDGGAIMGDLDIGSQVVSPFLWKKKITQLDYVVLSHAQRDHMAGLGFILENFKTGEFLWNGNGLLKGLDETIRDRDIKVSLIDDQSPPLLINGVKVEFLNPPKNSQYDVNDNSLVLRVAYGEREFLFTGDIGSRAESALVGKDIGSDVLKVPHHGSKGSSSPDFLRAVGASVAVVSAGTGNIFGLPHPDTLERFSSAGTRLFRTDTDGAVTIVTDGKGLKASTYLTNEGL
ncbi:MAG: DNA internalization-related competence protein ComEC/Rec2 [Deltaproteobacteria bacterium]|nr:DNA internalization-related competence protein ComEC/Rec2 [Deltaproteobacteria bacterium]